MEILLQQLVNSLVHISQSHEQAEEKDRDKQSESRKQQSRRHIHTKRGLCAILSQLSHTHKQLTIFWSHHASNHSQNPLTQENKSSSNECKQATAKKDHSPQSHTHTSKHHAVSCPGTTVGKHWETLEHTGGKGCRPSLLPWGNKKTLFVRFARVVAHKDDTIYFDPKREEEGDGRFSGDLPPPLLPCLQNHLFNSFAHSRPSHREGETRRDSSQNQNRSDVPCFTSLCHSTLLLGDISCL